MTQNDLTGSEVLLLYFGSGTQQQDCERFKDITEQQETAEYLARQAAVKAKEEKRLAALKLAMEAKTAKRRTQ